jgi:hypothetical protein
MPAPQVDLRRRLQATYSVPGLQLQLTASLGRLNHDHDLLSKWQSEPGLGDILEELYGRLLRAFGSLEAVAGLHVLDIACGSNSSRAPEVFHLRTPSGQQPIESSAGGGYAAIFEPWFCRILETLGAVPVGVDRGDLQGETFETHTLDLGHPGALDALPGGAFDGVQDSRLFGSPEFTAQFPDPADRLAVAVEIVRQEDRLLKPGGVVIHSDARGLINRPSS